MEPSGNYEFGEFRLDRRSRILLKGDATVALTPKAVDLLLVLVDKKGQLAAKSELMAAVWPDTFVEESNLTSNISLLRRQLGVHPAGGEYIETIPKRGYRFVAPVTEMSGEISMLSRESIVPAGTPGTARALGHERSAPGNSQKRALRLRVVMAAAAGLCVLLTLYLERSHFISPPKGRAPEALAVLPLENLSGDPAQDYFADGMTEALTADLFDLRLHQVGLGDQAAVDDLVFGEGEGDPEGNRRRARDQGEDADVDEG